MENAPKTFRAVYVETDENEFKTVTKDGKEIKIPGRNLGRFGFVTTGQTVSLTQEEYDAVANDPRFLTPDQYASRSKKPGAKAGNDGKSAEEDKGSGEEKSKA